jgi:thiamine phosphate synthase YjbQ (UPF0047 family)
MNSVTEYLTFNVPSRRGFVNITSQVEKIVQKNGIKKSICLVNAMHITSRCLSMIMKLDYITIMKNG